VTHYLSHHAGARFNAVHDPAFAPEHYGIAVKKGHAALLGKLNRGLAAIKTDGTYERIVAKYFGAAASAPAQLPR
jgi:polar amino acid transport system substrate-binding protein